MSNHPYKPGPLLSQITVPSDLRTNFTEEQLPQVAQELRQYIVDVISEIGNSHFGASLGVVELTVALHYAFNTPDDQLVWDVGHQAYGHKILTGRRERFHTKIAGKFFTAVALFLIFLRLDPSLTVYG